MDCFHSRSPTKVKKLEAKDMITKHKPMSPEDREKNMALLSHTRAVRHFHYIFIKSLYL